MVISLKQGLRQVLLLLNVALLLGCQLLIVVISGVSALASLLIYGRIHGFRQVLMEEWFHLGLGRFIRKSVNLSVRLQVTGMCNFLIVYSMMNVGRILRIPLNRNGFNDFIAWGVTPHGMYTVKSAYYLRWRHHFGAWAQ
jgi:hypothetical protein